jgi:hypothetical protein
MQPSSAHTLSAPHTRLRRGSARTEEPFSDSDSSLIGASLPAFSPRAPRPITPAERELTLIGTSEVRG